MSTKAIRYLIQLVRTGHEPTEINLDAAERDVAAIERAAKDILNEDTESADTAKCEPAMAAYTAGMAVLERIAKDAP